MIDVLRGDKNFLRDNAMFHEISINGIDVISRYEDIGLLENDTYKLYVENGLVTITELSTNAIWRFPYKSEAEIACAVNIIRDCGF